MVSIDELKKLVKVRKQLNELPSEFIGTLEAERIQEDSRGRQALFWDIRLESGELVTQKFTGGHLGTLLEAVEKLGFKSTDEMIGKKFKWRITHFRIGNPRWVPVELLS